jgi:hypothetical protein
MMVIDISQRITEFALAADISCIVIYQDINIYPSSAI